MSQWRSNSFGSKNATVGGVIPNAVKMFMNQQNKTIDGGADSSTSLDFVSKKTTSTSPLAAFDSQQKSVETAAPAASTADEKADKKSLTPKMILASAAPGAMVPLTGSLVDAIKATAGAASKKDSLDGVKALEKKPVVTADAIAAEEFMASLANPLFKQMPVDKSLAAALRSMNGVTVNTPSKKFEILASLEKKKRRKRRSVADAYLEKHMQRRRAAATPSSSEMSKPMERSSMETPSIASSQQGPQLLDKIRDMGRVVATP